jgi:putative transposase
MPWQTSTPMTQRQLFIEALLAQRGTLRALCAEFGISEKTGYKWRARFLSGGPAALSDRSHAPHVAPHQPAAAVREAILALREAHPTWGPRKLKVWLTTRHPTTTWPAASTISTLCKRAGLVPSRRRRNPAASRWATSHLTTAVAPNRVWATDFKGEFRLRSGAYCYPLTATDLFSRYVLTCDALASTASAPVHQAFTALFQQHGLPDVIRSDNGVPFAQPSALGGLSALSVWWMRLGIRPERITKGKPTENGAHERMHRTLKAEAVQPEATLAAQQRRFTRWQHEFNTERPHEALGLTPPAAHYVASDRRWPRRLPTIDYAPHLALRRVDANGCIRFQAQPIRLSTTLQGEYVAIEETHDARYRIRYSKLQLGYWVATDDTFDPDLRWLESTE